ncbi:hypothetical protein JCM19233_5541 [Vibrio astriarenae]|nr:hypothetical protein JCM19233_5541 [Vibrio sp. C7]
MKFQDEEAYLALKTACLTYSHDNLATLGAIGEDDIEEQAEHCSIAAMFLKFLRQNHYLVCFVKYGPSGKYVDWSP